MKLNEVSKVFISGVSKGIGFELAKMYLNNNIRVYGVARNTKPIHEWANSHEKENLLETFSVDLSSIENCKVLAQDLDTHDFDIMINNAGFGVFGPFETNDVYEELEMIDLNIKSLHFMTKYFYHKYYESDSEKRIINVASVAAFQPGPLFASYYASKSYVLSLGRAINFEAKKAKSKVSVITLCPGPLKTNFWNNANYEARDLPTSAMPLDKFIKKAFKAFLKTKKDVIVLGGINKFLINSQRLVSTKVVMNQVYKFQNKRKEA